MDRADLVGQAIGTVRAGETNAGHVIRVFGEDGACSGGTDDFNSDRVNVVIEDGTVVWASMY